MVLLGADPFLNELNKLFDKGKGKDAIYITLKRCNVSQQAYVTSRHTERNKSQLTSNSMCSKFKAQKQQKGVSCKPTLR